MCENICSTFEPDSTNKAAFYFIPYSSLIEKYVELQEKWVLHHMNGRKLPGNCFKFDLNIIKHYFQAAGQS